MMDLMILEVGDAEYKQFLISLPAHQRICHEFEEDHPLFGYSNLIDPKTGNIVILRPDCMSGIPRATQAGKL